jgi:methyl-accepting chemotaxis protein
MSDSNLEVRVSALEWQMQEIRELLQQTAQQQAENMQALRETRAITESNARAIEALANQTQETRNLVESNARAIEALNAHTAEARDEAEEERSEFRLAIQQLIRDGQRNEVEHELFRRRFEAIDPLVDEE